MNIKKPKPSMILSVKEAKELFGKIKLTHQINQVIDKEKKCSLRYKASKYDSWREG
jgi:hypothetical protein